MLIIIVSGELVLKADSAKLEKSIAVFSSCLPVTASCLSLSLVRKIYNHGFSGEMPQDVCDLRDPQGMLTSLTADCMDNALHYVECSEMICCTMCFRG